MPHPSATTSTSAPSIPNGRIASISTFIRLLIVYFNHNTKITLALCYFFFNSQRKVCENGTFIVGKKYIPDRILAPNTEATDDFNSIGS